MNRAHALFGALMGSGSLLLGFALATAAHVLWFTMDDALSAGGLIVHWCIAAFSGSALLHELLFVALLGLIPIPFTVAAVSVARQCASTRRLLASFPVVSWSRLTPPQVDVIARLGLARRISIAENSVPIAFCHGLLRPHISVSTGLLDLLSDRELEAVLIHERHHMRCYDPLRVMLSQAVGQALFFLPIASDLQHEFLSAKELAADAAVIRAQRSSYPLASALFRLITCNAVSMTPAAAVVGVADDIDRRIAHLLDPQAAPRLEYSVRGIMASALIPLSLLLLIMYPGLVDFTAHIHAATTGTAATCPG